MTTPDDEKPKDETINVIVPPDGLPIVEGNRVEGHLSVTANVAHITYVNNVVGPAPAKSAWWRQYFGSTLVGIVVAVVAAALVALLGIG